MSVFFVTVLTAFTVVFAETPPEISIKETVDNNNTVTALVAIPPNVSAAGTINIKYNADKLKLISAEQGKANAQMINVNHEKNLIVINYLNAQGHITGNTEIAVIKLKLMSNNFSVGDIYAESFEIYNIDSELIADNTTANVNYTVDSDKAQSNVSIDSTPPQQTGAGSKQSTDSSSDSDKSAPESSAKNSTGDSDSESTNENVNSASSASENSKSNSEISNISDADLSSDSIEKSDALSDNNDNSTIISKNSESEKHSNVILTSILIVISVVIVSAVTAVIIIKKQQSDKTK